jgi:hypothetical protein
MGARDTRRATTWIAAALATIVAGLASSPAAGEMRTTKLDRHLCKTVHGGRFVPIPGFPGEKIDRRLLPDIRWMKRRFDIFITDGYSTDPVHAPNGEHPIGLAADIVPNKGKGGTWGEIGELARLAEPDQNAPVPPWRWVGWNGDAGHGRGDHLHLSWTHSSVRPRHTARVVYTRKCPRTKEEEPKRRRHRHRASNGGTSPTGDAGSPPNGGIPASAKIAPVVPED